MKSDWLKRRPANPTTRLRVTLLALLTSLSAVPTALSAEESPGVQPLLAIPLSEVHGELPRGTYVLIDATAIEQFLVEVDGGPPDWAALYGHGHHDPEHNERLFKLNRDRDAKREGRQALQRRIAFVWSGALSSYDPDSGGFPVSLGPRFTLTSWGLVRFKYEDLPGNLVAIPAPRQRDILLRRIAQERSIEIDVVMLGTLIQEESIVYDFSHEEEGRGVVMPVVRVHEVFYLHAP